MAAADRGPQVTEMKEETLLTRRESDALFRQWLQEHGGGKSTAAPKLPVAEVMRRANGMADMFSAPLTEQNVAEFLRTHYGADARTQGLTAEAFFELLRWKHMRDVFDKIDADKSGEIDQSELSAALHALGVGRTATPEQLQEMMQAVDTDQSGSVDFEEFCAYFGQLKSVSMKHVTEAWSLPTARSADALFVRWLQEFGGSKGSQVLPVAETIRRANEVHLFSTELCSADIEEYLQTEKMSLSAVNALGGISEKQFMSLLQHKRMRDVFDQIDADGSGEIDLGELRLALRALGIRGMSSTQIGKLMDEVDLDNSGTVDFEEFRTYFGRLKSVSLRNVAQAWAATGGMDVGSDMSAPLPGQGEGSNVQLWHFVFAGGLGGVVSRTATAPLERIKLQSQVLGGQGSIMGQLRAIYQAEGMRGLFAGNLANCVRVFPFGGTVCLTYSQLTKIMPMEDGTDPLEPVWRAVAGAGAGLVATLLTYPLDVVRLRMALQSTANAAASAFQYTGVRHALTTLFREEGARGLFRGVGPSLAAMVPFVAAQNSFYDILREGLVDRFDITPSPWLYLGCGATAGAVAQSVVFPLDLIRRRLQMETSAGATARVGNVFGGLLRSGGVRALFSGFTPSLAKVMPAVAVSVSVRDAVKSSLHSS